jgi:hypothetical protein
MVPHYEAPSANVTATPRHPGSTTASDIRGDYRELLEDQVPDGEATRRIIEDSRQLAGG